MYSIYIKCKKGTEKDDDDETSSKLMYEGEICNMTIMTTQSQLGLSQNSFKNFTKHKTE